MALDKQPVNINFAGGLDLKTDPYQVSAGKFEALNNSVFDSLQRLTKRNGFGSFPANPSNSPIAISTYKGSAVAIGNGLGIQNYSDQANTWQEKGPYVPVTTSVIGAVRNSRNQSACDLAVVGNIGCIVFNESVQNENPYAWRYSIINVNTGENIIAPVNILPSSGTNFGAPRVFVLGSYFIILFTCTISSVQHLEYLAINTTTFNLVSSTGTNLASIVSQFSPLAFAVPCAWDAVVIGSNLFFAYGGTSSSGVKINYLTSTLSVGGSPVNPDSSHQPTSIGVCVDTTQSPNTLWVMYGVSGSSVVYALCVTGNTSMTTILGGTSIATSVTPANITGYATAGACTCLYEGVTSQPWDSQLPLINTFFNSVTQGGSVGTAATYAYQQGLSSKCFLYNSQYCVFTSFSSPYQPSYFLNGQTGPQNVIMRLAYSNGAGYTYYLLPNVPTINGVSYFSYLYKDLIESVNKGTDQITSATNPVSPGGIYSQTGINIAAITQSTAITTTEIGTTLNISGGFVTSYDGTTAAENNFFLWPELICNPTNVTTANPNGYGGITGGSVSFSATCTTILGSNILLYNSGGSGVYPGMVVTGTGIPSNTYLTQIGPGTGQFIMSQKATAAGSSVMVTTKGGVEASKTYYYQFIYQWTDNQGNITNSAPSVPIAYVNSNSNALVEIIVPLLPTTNRNATDVVITGYRWSTGQSSYFQFTPVSQTGTATSVGYITIYDAFADSSILGNNLLYTTGGVVEDISPPPTSVVTLFDDRVWLVDAEDTNLLWFSKQSIEATPVEFSDLLTYYVAPTSGSQSSTGPVTALFPMDDKLIVFSKNAIRYINGSGPDNTGANSQYSQPIFITSPVGCSNQASITMIPDGLMFQSDHGIWLLDHGLNVSYIGAEVEKYNQYTVLDAKTISGTTQVRFSMSNGIILMYDYFVKQWGTFTGVSPVSTCIYNGLHTLLDGSGNVYQETPGTYVDGASTNVAMSFTTSWLKLDGLRGYQRAYFYFFLGTWLTNFELQCQMFYDYSTTANQTTTFTPTNTVANTELQERIFLTQQRCKALQIAVTEVIANAGAGFTLSGMNIQMGFKKGYAPSTAAQSTS